MEAPPGFWQRDAAHGPLPRTPMTNSLLPEDDGLVAASEDFGLILTPRVTDIGGWFYGSIEAVGGPAGAAPPPGWLLPILLRLSPDARRRLRRCREVVRTGHAERVVDRWYAEQQPVFRERIHRLRDTDLPAADNLPELLAEAKALCHDGVHAHFPVIMAHVAGVGELGVICQRLLGWDQREVMALLAGLSSKTTEPLDALAEDDTVFLREYGFRSLILEVAEPTLGEMPGLTRRLLRKSGDDGALSRQREEKVAAARKLLHGADRTAFDRALAIATKAYPAREDNVFYCMDGPVGIARRVVVEAGRRLTERDQLDECDDVFFVEIDEVIAALTDRRDLRPVVKENRALHQLMLANPGPPTYGKDPGPPPSTRWLPAGIRDFTEAVAWGINEILQQNLSVRTAEPQNQVLTGTPASKGRYRGEVRVVVGEPDFDRLRKGDVLVCPSTRPSWSVLFPLMGAIVTDSGGALSHPAIIAREYGIPAVVAMGNATTVLHDGQTVVVDGDRGTVEIV
ncbi:PEP-utilizing enzyme [Fodinicola acaciae]|uniref:PEP-utilizing enzyme n=1 Tax=Fodinicola acaciae TaxID=2681555 RepID=UPI0013D67AB7|nr:PEP-utilizing enzyme [Fodinicola acaciae]